MKILPLRSNRHLLDTVFGRLTAEQTSEVWDELLKADELLRGLAQYLGHQIATGRPSHLELLSNGGGTIVGRTGDCLGGHGAM